MSPNRRPPPVSRSTDLGRRARGDARDLRPGGRKSLASATFDGHTDTSWVPRRDELPGRPTSPAPGTDSRSSWAPAALRDLPGRPSMAPRRSDAGTRDDLAPPAGIEPATCGLGNCSNASPGSINAYHPVPSSRHDANQSVQPVPRNPPCCGPSVTTALPRALPSGSTKADNTPNREQHT